jgi:hypothetical protein
VIRPLPATAGEGQYSTVIPGRDEVANPGIHRAAYAEAKWIPGLAPSGHPGMTKSNKSGYEEPKKWNFDLSEEQRLLKESIDGLLTDSYDFEQRRST